MCCSTGLCGPEPDAALIQFAANLKALTAEGVAVERFNLAQRPEAFVAQPAVRTAIETLGTDVLPLVVRDGQIVSHSRYPSLAELRMLATPESTPERPFSLDITPGCAPDSGCC